MSIEKALSKIKSYRKSILEYPNPYQPDIDLDVLDEIIDFIEKHIK